MNPGTDQFNWVIPSNSCMDKYPHNDTAEFSVDLPVPLALEDEWEVGVVSIYFPHEISLINSFNTRAWYGSEDASLWEDLTPIKIKPAIRIDLDLFKDNKWFSKYNEINAPFKLKFRNQDGHFLENMAENLIVISGELVKIIRPTPDDFGKWLHMWRGRGAKLRIEKISPKVLTHITVKTNLIRSTYLDSDRDRFLLIAPVPESGRTEYRPQLVTYFPLSCNTIKTATFKIETNLQEKAQFAKGSTVIELHFRKKRIFY